MKQLFLSVIIFLTISCSQEPKQLSNVSKGMEKEEVLKNAGAPSSKNNIGIAELWVYKNSDRTVIFRKDTVYDIITSADARIDSIKSLLQNTGAGIKKGIENTGDSIEKIGNKIKETVKPDSTSKK